MKPQSDEKVELIQEQTRNKVTLTILYALLLSLACAAIYDGINNDNFRYLSVVWSNSQPFLVMILGYYLSPKNSKNS